MEAELNTAYQKGRNSVIDVSRLVFALVILLYHSNLVTDGELYLFRCGYIGVEFFFLVSGWLLMAEVMKKPAIPSGCGTLGAESLAYVFKKAAAVYPYYFPAFFMSLAVRAAVLIMEGTPELLSGSRLVNTLWELLMLQMCGVRWSFAVNGVAWYLSAMLLAMLVIYPAARKFRDNFICLIAPVVSLLLLASLSIRFNSLNLIYDGESIVPPGLIRALAVMSLGAVSYRFSGLIREMASKLKGAPLLLGLVELGCYGAVLLLCFFRFGENLDMTLLLLLFVAISVSFSGESVLGQNIHIKSTGAFSKISLMLLLSQRCWLYLIPHMPIESAAARLIVYFVLSFAAAGLIWLIGDALKNCFKKLAV